MRYLNNNEFIKTTEKNITIYCKKGLSEQSCKDIINLSCNTLKQQTPYSLEDIEINNGSRILLKSRILNHRNDRLKATLGVKRCRSYIRSVAEIDNLIKLVNCPYIPKILGYGFTSGKFRLINKIILITE